MGTNTVKENDGLIENNKTAQCDIGMNIEDITSAVWNVLNNNEKLF